MTLLEGPPAHVTPAEVVAHPPASPPQVAASPWPNPPAVSPAAASGWHHVVRGALVMLAVVSLTMTLGLSIVSHVQHASSQTRLREQFNAELSASTAPSALHDFRGRPLALGAPLAEIKIPAIGVDEVVSEGTTSGVLEAGPGHLRSSVFPGDAGDSVILGRRAAFGGPFSGISSLHRGAKITVITGAAKLRFKVLRVRHAGSHYPPMSAGTSGLTLVTATGAPFFPSGTVWVDAALVGQPVGTDPAIARGVQRSESPLGSDFSTLWALAFWLLAAAALASAAVRTWHRIGRPHAWIIFSAPMLLCLVMATDQFGRVLPNLL